MRPRLAALALLALAIATATSARAAEPVPFCGSQATPLLYVLKSYHDPATSPFIQNVSLYIQQGGSAVAVTSPRLPGRDLALNTFVLTGQGRPETYQRLLAAMAEVHIGFQSDCRFLDPVAAESETRITWYGKGTRQRTFLVSSHDLGQPDCPPAMEDLLDELLTYAGLLTHLQSLPANPGPTS